LHTEIIVKEWAERCTNGPEDFALVMDNAVLLLNLFRPRKKK